MSILSSFRNVYLGRWNLTDGISTRRHCTRLVEKEYWKSNNKNTQKVDEINIRKLAIVISLLLHLPLIYLEELI